MHRLHDKLCKQHGFINPGPVYKLSSVCPRFQAMTAAVYLPGENPSTGFHTNEAESENNRLKKWSRTRYGKLQLNVSEMDEYVFYVNVGSRMCDVFHGLAMANGGACSNRVLAIA